MRFTLSQYSGAVLVAVVLGVGVTGAARGFAHQRWENGSHFVTGSADPAGVVVTNGASKNCGFNKGNVYVPAKLSVAHIAHAPRTEQWVTLHLTATVTGRRGGPDLVASGTKDVPWRVGDRGTVYVRVPVDDSLSQSQVTRCTVTKWTMTPGAWLPNDD